MLLSFFPIFFNKQGKEARKSNYARTSEPQPSCNHHIHTALDHNFTLWVETRIENK